MTLYGHARVSTEEQPLERQLDALLVHGVEREHIHEETASSAAERRPVLDHLLGEVLAAGDTLVITDLDRLSRRTARIILTLDELATRGVTVESLVDTSTADGLFSVTILGALAPRERERTRAGLAGARASGRHLGRPVAITPEQHETVLMLRGLGKPYRQVAASTGTTPSTVVRICRGETPEHSRYRQTQPTDATDRRNKRHHSSGSDRMHDTSSILDGVAVRGLNDRQSGTHPPSNPGRCGILVPGNCYRGPTPN